MGNQRKLVLASFSQTISDTNELTLSGDNMETIKLQAIQKMFGNEGTYFFQEIQKIKPNIPIQESIVMLLSRKECCLSLLDYMQIGSLDLFKRDPTYSIYKEFVNLNVVKLYDIIGSPNVTNKRWPHIYPGFKEFRKLLFKYNIDFGVVSSGYEDFIVDVFSQYEITRPLFCVTPEDDFGLLDIDWASKNKPSRLLISQAINYWAKYKPGLDIEYAFENTIMIGDDLYLDGKMAENAGIPFWYFTSDINAVVLKENQRSFSNWWQLVNALKNNQLF